MSVSNFNYNDNYDGLLTTTLQKIQHFEKIHSRDKSSCKPVSINTLQKNILENSQNTKQENQSNPPSRRNLITSLTSSISSDKIVEINNDSINTESFDNAFTLENGDVSPPGNNTVYPLVSYSGNVVNQNGQLTSTNPVISALLKLLSPQEINTLGLTGQITLTIRIDPNTGGGVNTLNDLCTIDDIKLTPGVLKLLTQDVNDESIIVRDKNNSKIHPRDVLSSSEIEIESKNKDLEALIQSKINNNNDLKVQLAATAALDNDYSKKIDKWTAVGLAGSIIIACLFGLAEYFAIEAATAAGYSPVALAAIASALSSGAEGTDTAGLKTLFKYVKKELIKYSETMKDFFVGAFAAGVGSFFNNLVEHIGIKGSVGLRIASFFTTQLAVLACGCGVFMEPLEHREKISEVLEGENDQAPSKTKLQFPRLTQETAQQLETACINLSPVDRTILQTVPLASAIALFSSVLATSDVLSPETLVGLNIVAFGPIEAWGYIILTYLSKLSFGSLKTSDSQKMEKLTQLVIQKASAKALEPSDVEAQANSTSKKTISDQEFDEIFGSRFDSRAIGTVMITTLMAIVGFIPMLLASGYAAATRGKKEQDSNDNGLGDAPQLSETSS